jgi:SAM-dependent methyltransferase
MSGKSTVPRRSRWPMVATTLALLAGCARGGTPVAPPRPTATASAATPPSGVDAGAPSETPRPSADRPQATAAPEPKLDVIYWASPQPIVDRMLELAQVKSSDVVYDLGCGDARSLVTAAKRYGARGFGFDLDPRRVAEARESARQNGVEHLVRVEQADIFQLDLSPADVVFLFLLTRLNERLLPQLVKLRPGSRIVSHEFDMAGAQPTRILRVSGPPDGPPGTDPQVTAMHKLYLWQVPWRKQPGAVPAQ